MNNYYRWRLSCLGLALYAVCLSLLSAQAFTPSQTTALSTRQLRQKPTFWASLTSDDTSSAPTTVPQESSNQFPPGSTLVLTDPETQCEIVLLGCFHGSSSSAQDVTTCLTVPTSLSSSQDVGQAQQPRQAKNVVVALELCASRFVDLRKDVQKERQGETSTTTRARPWPIRFAEMVQSTMKQRGFATGMAAALLGGVSGMQTALSGLQPGLEFQTALCHVMDLEEDGHNNNDMTIVLADKNVDETLDSIGSIPTVAMDLWKDFLRNPTQNWSTTFGREAVALGQAVGLAYGDNQSDDHLTLGGFATRSPTAIRDLLRLLLPPVAFLQGSVVAVNVAFEWLQNQPEWMEAAATATATNGGGGGDTVADIWYWSNLLLMSSLYMSVALPAVRVILRERDDILTANIREACRLATEDGSQSGRVVAVLGLLHVNGVARRLLADHSEAETNTR